MKIRWSSAVLDLVPAYCLRCESRIKDIYLQRIPAIDAVVVRCVGCGYTVARISGEALRQQVHQELAHGTQVHQ